MPRVELAADYPLEPLPAELPQWQRGRQARAWSPQRQLADRGHYSGVRRPHGFPDGSPPVDHQLREARRGPVPRATADYQRQVGFAGGQQEPASWRYRSGHPGNGDPLWSAAQVLALADGRAAQIAQEAHDSAAEIREAAERHAAAITEQATTRADAITRQATELAAAIREEAEREATELRARLGSMTGELGRVAAYVTESLGAPAMPAPATTVDAAAPAALRALPVRPDVRPARPDATPPRPDARPSSPDARPGGKPTKRDSSLVRPDTEPRPAARPAEPRAVPAAQPQKRQVRAMRIAKYGTATLLLFSVVTGVTELGLHGYKFFVFRAGGVGQTPGNETDQQFLARQNAAAHNAAAPKGRHHRPSHPDGQTSSR